MAGEFLSIFLQRGLGLCPVQLLPPVVVGVCGLGGGGGGGFVVLFLFLFIVVVLHID